MRRVYAILSYKQENWLVSFTSMQVYSDCVEAMKGSTVLRNAWMFKKTTATRLQSHQVQSAKENCYSMKEHFMEWVTRIQGSWVI